MSLTSELSQGVLRLVRKGEQPVKQHIEQLETSKRSSNERTWCGKILSGNNDDKIRVAVPFGVCCHQLCVKREEP